MRTYSAGLARLFGLIVAALFATLPAFAYDTSLPALEQFIDEMTQEHGFDCAETTELLTQAKRKQSVIDAISRPAEKTLTWQDYRAIFLTPQRVDAGIRFWREHAALLEAAEERFGVPPSVIVGILGVESIYGDNTGNYRVIDALATLAFDYPPRSEFFRGELEQFLLLTRESGFDPLMPTGSYAGAMGAPQFISSSYRRYAVDGDGDGRVDLWNNWNDIVFSVANYLKENGWHHGRPVAVHAVLTEPAAENLVQTKPKLNSTAGKLRRAGVSFDADVRNRYKAALFELDGRHEPEHRVGFHNFRVITRYNVSVLYAMAVHDLGGEVAQRVY